ncbi:TerC family protein [Dongshaea marina]|uniref:TerC family protein n=1 Tax=Dongshaea marina TaxID=2047966 RepID=UPI000D3E4ACA|nr:TerC family protein [Dongshaea marina]
MTTTTWLIFLGLIALMLLVDLLQSKDGPMPVKKAAYWSLGWFVLALAFGLVVYLFWPQLAPTSELNGSQAATAYITGYLLEKSLSVDNLFVFAVIFAQFRMPESLRPKVLLWGVIGALVLRGIMIAVGVQLINQFHWLIYLFALFLLYTGYKLATEKEHGDESPQDSRIMRWVQKVVPTTSEYDGSRLTTRVNGRRLATPLLAILPVIAFTDVIFALDSIPAIFAVTREPFLVFSANVFALLGLRALYFVLEGMLERFCYLKPALAFILSFIGVKMLLMETPWAIPTLVSLAVIIVTLTLAIGASFWKTRSMEPRPGQGKLEQQ